jgi:hypothetical protein
MSVSYLAAFAVTALCADKKGEGEGSDSEEEDNSTSLLSVSACNNTLNLVMRDEGVMRYVLCSCCTYCTAAVWPPPLCVPFLCCAF